MVDGRIYSVADYTDSSIQGRFGITMLDLFSTGSAAKLKKLGVKFSQAFIYYDN